MNDYDSDDIFFMLSKGIFLGYFTFEHIFDYKVSLIKLWYIWKKQKYQGYFLIINHSN